MYKYLLRNTMINLFPEQFAYVTELLKTYRIPFTTVNDSCYFKLNSNQNIKLNDISYILMMDYNDIDICLRRLLWK